jgi:ribonuclease Z
VDLLVCESTYLDSEREEAHSHFHMTARQAAEVAQKAGARRLVLTHFSQRYEDTAAFAQEAQALVQDVVAVRE